MVLFREGKLTERGTVYQKITSKEAWAKMAAWIKEGSDFQAHLGLYNGCLSTMEGRYTKILFRGTYIVFKDVRIPFNQFWLYYKDIVGAEFGEDQEAGYRTLRVDLRSKAFITVTPVS